jgi:hypothetical protein
MNITYVKSDSSEWGKILKTAHIYKNLMKDGLIVKAGNYYPRLKATKKRGLIAYTEIKRKYFNDETVNKSFLDDIIKNKHIPNDNIDSLEILEFNIEKYKILKELKSNNQLEENDTPFGLPIQNINEVDEGIKMHTVLNYIEELEFTPQQIVMLQMKLSKYLYDNL